jgi:hypothetical protein
MQPNFTHSSNRRAERDTARICQRSSSPSPPTSRTRSRRVERDDAQYRERSRLFVCDQIPG